MPEIRVWISLEGLAPEGVTKLVPLDINCVKLCPVKQHIVTHLKAITNELMGKQQEIRLGITSNFL